MALVYRHNTVNGDQVRRIQDDPDSATSADDLAVLDVLTAPDKVLRSKLGHFSVGHFEPSDDSDADELLGTLPDGSVDTVDRGFVVADLQTSDGVYEVFTSV